MKPFLNWIAALGTHYDANEQERKQAGIMLRLVLLLAGFSFLYILVASSVAPLRGIVVQGVQGGLSLLLLVLFRLRVNLRLIGNLFVLIACGTLVFHVYNTGGIRSPVLPWLAPLPLAALLLINRFWAAVWTGVSVSLILGLAWLGARGYAFPRAFPPELEITLITNSLLGLVVLCLAINLVFEHGLRVASRRLEQEKEVSEDLLRNILPEEVMQELKRTGRTTPRHYKLVTVLFADFKDFTLLSQTMSPEELVTGIDEYFEAFDHIIGKYHVEKIKTVGDAYICAAGLPEEDPDNPSIIIEVALDMIDAVSALRERRQALGQAPFEVRIGVHSGPLVAGVVGIRKFAYDIWGDTVNTAARMQQMGEPGRINVSEATYTLVCHRFACEPRGLITAKNKGDMAMFFIRPRPAQVAAVAASAV